MNIFALHRIPLVAASMHSDKHVVKMVLETAQILATVHHIHGNGDAVKYKPTHAKHPCVVWAAASRSNYQWLVELGYCLAKEFKMRYGKFHACHDLFYGELRNPPPALKFAAPTPFAQAMPDECKDADPVVAYRRYYQKKTDENSWMSWERASVGCPNWLNLPSKINDLQIFS
jgi:hypothetical protein